MPRFIYDLLWTAVNNGRGGVVVGHIAKTVSVWS